MTTHCVSCGKKVPKKRKENERSPYAGFFCGKKCHIAYADQVIGMARESELEVQREISQEINAGQGPWSELLEDLDQVAADATSGAGKPQEIVARFVGAMAGKFATKVIPTIYGTLSDKVKSWGDKGTPSGSAPTSPPTPTTPPARPATPPPATPPPSNRPTPQAPRQESKAPPPRTETPPPRTPIQPQPTPDQTRLKKTPEPPDLETRPLEEQREWLLRRFYLPVNTTREELEAKYRMLVRKYHPDRPGGNGKIMSVINATRQRIIAIDEELEDTPKRRRR